MFRDTLALLIALCGSQGACSSFSRQDTSLLGKRIPCGHMEGHPLLTQAWHGTALVHENK